MEGQGFGGDAVACDADAPGGGGWGDGDVVLARGARGEAVVAELLRCGPPLPLLSDAEGVVACGVALGVEEGGGDGDEALGVAGGEVVSGAVGEGEAEGVGCVVGAGVGFDEEAVGEEVEGWSEACDLVDACAGPEVASPGAWGCALGPGACDLGHVAALAGDAGFAEGSGSPLFACVEGAGEGLAGVFEDGLVAVEAEGFGAEAFGFARGVCGGGESFGAFDDAVSDVAGGAGDAFVAEGGVEVGVGEGAGSFDVVVIESDGPGLHLVEEGGVAVVAEPAVAAFFDLFLKLGVAPGEGVCGALPLGVDLGVACAAGGGAQVGESGGDGLVSALGLLFGGALLVEGLGLLEGCGVAAGGEGEEGEGERSEEGCGSHGLR